MLCSAGSPCSAWQLGDGPAIRLRSGGADRIEALVLEVASVERARTFLERERMLGASSEDQITIDPAAMQGIEIRLALPTGSRGG